MADDHVATEMFVIWSIEHDAWWAPAHQGYTCMLAEAGRYSEAESADIVTCANLVARDPVTGRVGAVFMHECRIPVACIK